MNKLLIAGILGLLFIGGCVDSNSKYSYSEYREKSIISAYDSKVAFLEEQITDLKGELHQQKRDWVVCTLEKQDCEAYYNSLQVNYFCSKITDGNSNGWWQHSEFPRYEEVDKELNERSLEQLGWID
ncbi:MAG: hypothetical protein EPO20_30575 [Betaproteobacteria bacterium]|nr:MAG: hypothetical protein EPO20_30575 [Betaproteobacteria bacterium]